MDIVDVIRILLLYYALSANGASALECHTCLISECRQDDLGCKKYIQTLHETMKEYYHGTHFFPRCPSVTDEGSWKLEELKTKPCPHDEPPNSATCTLGRIKINYKLNNQSTSIYATVTGCAKSILLQRMANASKERRGCDVMSIDNEKENYRISTQHCQDMENMCGDKDFCIRYEQTVVKKWDSGGGKVVFREPALQSWILFLGLFAGAILCGGCLILVLNIASSPIVPIENEMVQMKVVCTEGTHEESVQEEGDCENRVQDVVEVMSER